MRLAQFISCSLHSDPACEVERIDNNFTGASSTELLAVVGITGISIHGLSIFRGSTVTEQTTTALRICSQWA